MATTSLWHIEGRLKDLIAYVENPEKTVAAILERVEYIGHTENFKTSSKNYRSKKRVWNDKESRKLFENTHPAIID